MCPSVPGFSAIRGSFFSCCFQASLTSRHILHSILLPSHASLRNTITVFPHDPSELVQLLFQPLFAKLQIAMQISKKNNQMEIKLQSAEIAYYSKWIGSSTDNLWMFEASSHLALGFDREHVPTYLRWGFRYRPASQVTYCICRESIHLLPCPRTIIPDSLKAAADALERNPLHRFDLWTRPPGPVCLG